ncbi:MAG: ATP-binding protein, partial [Candidatus Auribacterota bacterium]|nr:ATP-binding protein [Candidatus Auribacterota bacterium]
LGGGDEQAGRRVLRKWQAGISREKPPEEFLSTTNPVIDDELFAIIKWTGWDNEVVFSIYDDQERHRVLDWMAAVVASSTGKNQGARLQQAVTEAFINVRQHAYRGNDGLVHVRFREEESCFRLEVEDEGINRFNESMVNKANSGFAVMEHFSYHVNIRHGKKTGIVVSIIVNKRG